MKEFKPKIKTIETIGYVIRVSKPNGRILFLSVIRGGMWTKDILTTINNASVYEGDDLYLAEQAMKYLRDDGLYRGNGRFISLKGSKFRLVKVKQVRRFLENDKEVELI